MEYLIPSDDEAPLTTPKIPHSPEHVITQPHPEPLLVPQHGPFPDYTLSDSEYQTNSDNLTPAPDLSSTGYIYVIWPQDAIRDNKQVFKVGRTYNVHQRLNGYGRFSEVLLSLRVRDPVSVETSLLRYLRGCPLFQQAPEFGHEYFALVSPSRSHVDLVRHVLTFLEGLDAILPMDNKNFLEAMQELKNRPSLKRIHHAKSKHKACKLARNKNKSPCALPLKRQAEAKNDTSIKELGTLESDEADGKQSVNDGASAQVVVIPVNTEKAMLEFFTTNWQAMLDFQKQQMTEAVPVTVVKDMFDRWALATYTSELTSGDIRALLKQATSNTLCRYLVNTYGIKKELYTFQNMSPAHQFGIKFTTTKEDDSIDLGKNPDKFIRRELSNFLTADDKVRGCKITKVTGKVAWIEDFTEAFNRYMDKHNKGVVPYLKLNQYEDVLLAHGFCLAKKHGHRENVCTACRQIGSSGRKRRACCNQFDYNNRTMKAVIYNMVLI